MAEVINNNVIEAGKKFVDFSGLDYFWTKAKNYIDGVDAAMSAKVVSLENVVGDSTKGLVQKVNLIQGELDGLNGGAGSITTQIENAIAALDLENTYEAKGAAADALEAAKTYADGLVDGKFDAAGAAAAAEQNAKDYADGLVMADGVAKFDAAGTAAGLDAAMDARVKVLEGINHEQIAADAASTAVAGVINGAPEKFDTLKEIADWISSSESADSAADLVTRVSALEAIDHDAYKAADTALETSLQGYVDGKVDGKFDAAGAAAQALADAKADAEAKYQVKGDYEAAGAAASAIAALDLPNTYEAKGAAADAQAAAIAQAKLDAAEALKAYYTKTEVDNLLSTNSTGDRAYAKQYTDELFNSIQFAANSDIDALFASKDE